MAYQRWWKTIRDQQGNAVNGAYCAVYNGGTGTLATIYDPNTDDSAPGNLANPFVTGPNGVFGFMAVDGLYDIKVSGGSLPSQQYRALLNASNSAQSPSVISSSDFGTVSDGAGASGASISAASAALVMASNTFSVNDIGKAIKVPGAGAAAADLVTTIAGYTDPKNVTLADDAGTTVSSVAVYWGTDNGPALNLALAYAAANGADLLIPKGIYLINSTPYLSSTLDRSISVRGYGATFILAGAVSGFKVSHSFAPNRVTVFGLKVFQYQNQSGEAGFDASDALHTVFRDCVVQADGSSAAFLPYKIKGTSSGGSYWSGLDTCTFRILASTSPSIAVQIQGYSNATFVKRCSLFGVSGSTTLIRLVANGGGDTYTPNAVVIEGNWFENFGDAVQIDGTGGASLPIGTIVQRNRFENGTNAISLVGTVQPTVPPRIADNYYGAPLTNKIYNPNNLYYIHNWVDSAGVGFVDQGNVNQIAKQVQGLKVQAPTGSATVLYVSRNSGSNGYISFYYAAAAKERWRLLHANDSESGSNVGSSLRVQAMDDSGVAIDTPVDLLRAPAGAITLGGTTNRPVVHKAHTCYTGKAFTANGATTTFTYPANTRYQYITTSAASLATTLPATSAALDGMVITFVAGAAVATATWVAGTGGATIVGAPADLVANTPVRMIYHHATTSWYPY